MYINYSRARRGKMYATLMMRASSEFQIRVLWEMVARERQGALSRIAW